MELIISAVEDVIVDTLVDDVYNKYESQNVKAEEILRLVKNRVGENFDNVKSIYLNMGPGSFTGIRASMALVLGLTAGKKINIIPFTTFDALEYTKLTAEKILAVNGFSNFVYVSYLGKNRKTIQDCITIEDLVQKVKDSKTLKVVLSNSDKVLKLLENYNVSTQKVEFDAKKVIQKYKIGALEKISFEPVYLRASQAELQRKENKK